MRLRSILIGMALLSSGTIIGATTQHLASAGVSSGERAVLIPIEPCRLADTRAAPNTVGPRSVPIGPTDTHTIKAQEVGTPCTGKIPIDATALSLNITALGATELSFLTVWAGGTRPNAASLNPAPGAPPVPNAVTTQISAGQEFSIYNESGSVAVVVDVNGYYVDHDHDDRYYTETESDARYLPPSSGEIFLAAAEFVTHLDGWTRPVLALRHDGASLGCVAAPLDIAPGTSISSVTFRYVTTADDAEAIEVTIGGLTRELVAATSTESYLDLHFYDESMPFPKTTTDIEAATSTGDPAPDGLTIKPVSADSDTSIALCVRNSVTILGVSIMLG